jgi:beta-lactamase superfamily II metal-dependent hydrolase
MYDVGFGDAFRVTVHDTVDTWRMLVDCGKHPQSVGSRPIAETVKAIIDDLTEDCGPGGPHLDVLVATHRHKDHIAGFERDDWQAVDVGEVWVPFVEDLKDPDATALRTKQNRAALQLDAQITRRLALAADGSNQAQMLQGAQAFAVNSSGNAAATDRLLGRGGRGFAKKHVVQYFPSTTVGRNTVDIGTCGIVAHILGPSRDPAMLARMDPPAKAGWLTLNLDDDSDTATANGRPLFGPRFILADSAVPASLTTLGKDLELDSLTNDSGLLAAASLLERSVNNTSLFFVLDVHGFKLLFPGDAQYGAWEHVRADSDARELIDSADFYKVGHHGSHNATPKDFVLTDWHTTGDAMVPWGLVEAWKSTIPKKELIKALKDTHHSVTLPTEGRRSAADVPPRGKLQRTESWSQLTFTVEDE